MTRRLTVLFAAVFLAALAGCGEKEEPTAAGGERDRFTIVLDWFPNADHAGIYAARAEKQFERAGLNVKIVTPPDPAAPLKLLQAGRADVAISYEPELLLARDKGADLVSVAAIVQKPLVSLMSLGDPAPVRSPRDLRGKKVGTAGIPYQSAYLKSIARAGGIPVDSVEEVNVGFDLAQALIGNRVDATLGGFWNYEGTDLEQRGRKPTVVRMEDAGVPTYSELILVARAKDLDEDGAARLRRFLQALSRGHEALREDAEPAVDALLRANKDLRRKLQAAVVQRTLPVFFPANEDRPWGYQDRREWAAYGRWMLENKLVDKDPAAAGALTNEFLPGQALAPGENETESAPGVAPGDER